MAKKDDKTTGLKYGPGQSNTTGNCPDEGGPNLDGPLDFDTSKTMDTPRGDGAGDSYSDPRNEQDRRDRHDGFDRTDISEEKKE